MNWSEFFSWRASFAGLTTTGFVVTAALTLAGFCGTWWWRFDLCSHFRVQYFLALAVAAVVLALYRRRRLALAALAFAVVNLVMILPFWFGRENSAHRDGLRHSVRIFVANVNTANTRIDLLREELVASQPDIVVLMEVDDRWMTNLAPIRSVYPYVEAAPRDDNFGIALFSLYALEKPRIIYAGNSRVPSILTRVKLEGQTMTLLATHPLPPADASYAEERNRQLRALAGIIREELRPAVLVGDLNLSPWSPWFSRLLREGELKDSARGWGVHPTWPTHMPLLWIPLDHCLVSSGVVVTGRRVGPPIGSDHYPLLVDLHL